MSFQVFLSELAKVLDFPSLSPDRYGACLIKMKEGEIHLLFEMDEQLVPNTILVSSVITSFPIEYRSVIYQTCLRGNHEIDTTLSVKPDEDLVYLHQRVHPEIQAEYLDKVLNSMIETIKIWREKIEILLREPPPTIEPFSLL